MKKLIKPAVAPEARPFAGTEVTVELYTVPREPHRPVVFDVRLSRAFAEALRDSLTEALAKLDCVRVGVDLCPLCGEDRNHPSQPRSGHRC